MLGERLIETVMSCLSLLAVRLKTMVMSLCETEVGGRLDSVVV